MKGPSITEIESVHHACEKGRRSRCAVVTIDDKRTWRSAVALDVITVVAQTSEAEHVLERQPDDACDWVPRHRAEHDNRRARHAGSPAADAISSGRRRSRCEVC